MKKLVSLEISGGLVTFGDGAEVIKVQLPSDYSTIRVCYNIFYLEMTADTIVD